MLTWKIVGASKASVLYIYIDYIIFVQYIYRFTHFTIHTNNIITKNKKIMHTISITRARAHTHTLSLSLSLSLSHTHTHTHIYI